MNSIVKSYLLAMCVALAEGQDTANGPVINTPTSLVQCLPSLISFSGGKPPYYVSAIPAGQTAAQPLADLGQHDAPFTWNVNLAGKTEISLQIRDTDGKINYSQGVKIQDSTNSTCLTETSKTTPSTPGSTNTAPVTPVTTGGTSTPTNTGSTGSTNSTPNKTTNSSPFVTSTNSSATTNNAKTGDAVSAHKNKFQVALVGSAVVASTMTLFA
uniref:Secreted protein n=1 Tax=Phakopsora pachyrhizi TaxID=170000 RepID=A0A0S1MIE7_PHAPC